MDWSSVYNNSKRLGEENSINQKLQDLEAEERYIDKEIYNEGGMKTIYTCLDLATDRELAFAIPKNDDKNTVETFLREAKLTAALQHPNIVPVYDIGVEHDKSYFVMKLIKGNSLEELLNRQDKNKDLHELLNIFLKICDAVNYAHSNGIIHLDLKPDNIQVSPHGEVLVCDWGLAKVIDVCKSEDNKFLDNETFYKADKIQHTLYGYIKGTPGYLSPEQAQGRKRPKSYTSDIYSLGAILYKVLTLQRPLQNEDLETTLLKTVKGAIPPPCSINKDTPKALEAICLKAMQKLEQNRYQSVDALIFDINQHLKGFPPKAQKANSFQKLTLFIRRHPLLCAISFSSIILISFISLSMSLLLSQKNSILEIQTQEITSQRDQIKTHLNSVKESKENLQKIALIAAKESYDRALAAWKIHHISKAHHHISRAVELDPNNLPFMELHAFTSIANLTPSEGSESIKKLINSYPQAYTALDKTNITKNSSGHELYTFFKKIDNKRFYPLQLATHYSFNRNTPHTTEKIDILPKIMNIHLRIAVRNFSWEYENEKYSINLSHNQKLKNLTALSGLKIKHLDISHTKSITLAGFRTPSLEFLNLSHSKIHEDALKSLNQRNFPKLKTLILDNCTFKKINFKYLARSTVETISLKNCSITNYSFLKDMQNLRNIYLDRLPTDFPNELIKLVSITP